MEKKLFLKPDTYYSVNEWLKMAEQHSNNPFGNQEIGKNKTIGLIFFNSSLRTRLSSIRAAENLGAKVWILEANRDGWKLEMEKGQVMDGDKAEHLQEAIKVMSRYCDILGVRAFPGLKHKEEDYSEKLLMDIYKYASVSVVSLESATRHPLQALADLLTIKQHFPNQKKITTVLSWAPHPKVLPHSVPNSFAEWCLALDGIDLRIANPEGYNLSPEFTGKAKIYHNQEEAFENVDIIYAKNWSSFEYYGEKPKVEKDWMITPEKMELTNHAKFMHCLPVRRNVVVSDQVLDSPQSIVIDEAENRIYSAQAVFAAFLKA